MKSVRFGIIGIGNMGTHHTKYLLDKKVSGAELTALCDTDPARLSPFGGVKHFRDSRELIRSGLVDAVLIATPHYDHTTIGMDAFANGLHVLVEKPISVHPADAERLIAAYRAAKKKNRAIKFGAMFQQRTNPNYQKIKNLIAAGELGEIRRVNWIITDWFRPDVYYSSGGWRATWRGEGGGVLLNQSPHNLDLLQWITGMPVRVRAYCHLGKYHDVEVEDEVTAYLEYKNGATGVFITSTGEAPGTNRLEISGDRGKLVVEGGKTTLVRNEIPMNVFCKTAKNPFSRPPVWNCEIPAGSGGGGHQEITQNFVNSILKGTPLLADATEGIHSVTLACAMLYSSFTGKTVEIPMDGKAYERHLQKLMAKSRFKKQTVSTVSADISASFSK
jgi:predicted dehydrogenase